MNTRPITSGSKRVHAKRGRRKQGRNNAWMQKAKVHKCAHWCCAPGYEKIRRIGVGIGGGGWGIHQQQSGKNKKRKLHRNAVKYSKQQLRSKPGGKENCNFLASQSTLS